MSAPENREEPGNAGEPVRRRAKFDFIGDSAARSISPAERCCNPEITLKSARTLGDSTAKQPQSVPFRQRVASPAKVLKLPHAFAAESSCSPRLLDDRCVATREFETLAAKAAEDVHRLTLGRKLKPRARHGAIKRRQPCAIKRRIWECPLVESEQPAAGLAPAWLPASPAHT